METFYLVKNEFSNKYPSNLDPWSVHWVGRKSTVNTRKVSSNDIDDSVFAKSPLNLATKALIRSTTYSTNAGNSSAELDQILHIEEIKDGMNMCDTWSDEMHIDVADVLRPNDSPPQIDETIFDKSPFNRAARSRKARRGRAPINNTDDFLPIGTLVCNTINQSENYERTTTDATSCKAFIETLDPIKRSGKNDKGCNHGNIEDLSTHIGIDNNHVESVEMKSTRKRVGKFLRRYLQFGGKTQAE
ncbi:unnamed protein product [Owenia fusiformis]|uniref:Uncharacterized protein n=1 Tax=Owenia fusiformis TaxID=6347 RepID=A0A8S4MU81_OWEFU|nr:unnamed protein product [Owenia fusiformis]